jgi:hypothetical protein
MLTAQRWTRLVNGLLSVAIALLAASWLAAAIAPAWRLFRRIPYGYNEGWNAYWAHIAWHGGPLYPPVDSPISNNYPPVSFYVVGALGRLLGDNIFAGRLVALLSLLLIAVNLWIWLRTIGLPRSVALFGATLFLATFADYAGRYIGSNDPQLMAHAIIVTGATVLFRCDFSRRAVLAGSLLMVFGGLTKHLVIALPLALTVWIAAYRRQQLAAWLTVSVAAVTVAIALIWLSFGTVFFHDLTASRVYSRSLIATGVQGVWQSFGLIVVVGVGALAPYLSRRSTRALREQAAFTLIYLGLAGIVGVLAVGGKGVDRNTFFDLLIAATLAVATVTEYLRARLVYANQQVVPLWGIGLIALGCSGVFAQRAASQWPLQWRKIQETSAREAETIRVLQSIRTLGHGATACEELSLCYWAGSDFKVDFFNFGQKLATGALPASDCWRVFSPHSVLLVEAERPPGDPRLSRRLPRDCNEAIARTYSLVATYSYGTVLLR